WTIRERIVDTGHVSENHVTEIVSRIDTALVFDSNRPKFGVGANYFRIAKGNADATGVIVCERDDIGSTGVLEICTAGANTSNTKHRSGTVNAGKQVVIRRVHDQRLQLRHRPVRMQLS